MKPYIGDKTFITRVWQKSEEHMLMRISWKRDFVLRRTFLSKSSFWVKLLQLNINTTTVALLFKKTLLSLGHLQCRYKHCEVQSAASKPVTVQSKNRKVKLLKKENNAVKINVNGKSRIDNRPFFISFINANRKYAKLYNWQFYFYSLHCSLKSVTFFCRNKLLQSVTGYDNTTSPACWKSFEQMVKIEWTS